MSVEAEKVIRVLNFDGKSDDFNMWERKFLAQAKIRGYEVILSGDLSGVSADKQKEMNDAAYGGLILACVDTVSFNIVDTSVSRSYPKGDAKLALDNLRDKFKP